MHFLQSAPLPSPDFWLGVAATLLGLCAVGVGMLLAIAVPELRRPWPRLADTVRAWPRLSRARAGRQQRAAARRWPAARAANEDGALNVTDRVDAEGGVL